MANSQHQSTSQSNPDQSGRGWLVNTTQQRLVHFKPELNSETTAWVSIRTYHYDPPNHLNPSAIAAFWIRTRSTPGT
ncbi:MAG: hypothetical protein CM15mP39_00890 [Synechococcus sp.]|nr:MAG: hypothetical protein CM15mP39_00890 [Synechococcus sp.]